MIKTAYFRLLALLILIGFVGQADALSQFALLTANRCVNCHITAQGGAQRDELGQYSMDRRGIARTQLRFAGKDRLCRWPDTHGCGYPRTNGAVSCIARSRTQSISDASRAI